ncbi:agmatinase, mitochondrial isoform X2 [Falco peregrinus]|uniref:agmatinase, mitochondrial isoform X2 n=1 Tax=Falco peregrinus TaxID=8954 RepID=UPI002478CF42|nr:agmatinase, mitochondrial isoform X2 [Falco peregrinus]
MLLMQQMLPHFSACAWREQNWTVAQHVPACPSCPVVLIPRQALVGDRLWCLFPVLAGKQSRRWEAGMGGQEEDLGGADPDLCPCPSGGVSGCTLNPGEGGGRSARPRCLRFGPRQIRAESAMVRRYNASTGAAPFDSLQVADIGDVNVNLYNLPDSCRFIRESYQKIVASGCVPLTLGGDHTITYPILQAVAEKHGPVGLVHVDAHTDTGDRALGEKIYHGTPFRRCVEEGLLDCSRVVQIGIRGSSYDPDPYQYCREQGFRVVLAEECWLKSLGPLMEEVRKQMGEQPVYITFDIDGLDPAYAPGTGTPEVAGLTPAQALEIIRGCKGLNLVGCDLVEVAPMYDVSGNTALLAANLLFEMLCALPRVQTVRGQLPPAPGATRL